MVSFFFSFQWVGIYSYRDWVHHKPANPSPRYVVKLLRSWLVSDEESDRRILTANFIFTLSDNNQLSSIPSEIGKLADLLELGCGKSFRICLHGLNCLQNPLFSSIFDDSFNTAACCFDRFKLWWFQSWFLHPHWNLAVVRVTKSPFA